jgi:hypothetical protein
MAKKSITNREISLIKTMVFSRKMKNRDIQFYFNRPDRPVNSGRITQIRDGSYGPEVLQATEEELDTFLADSSTTVSRALGEIAEPTLAEIAISFFEKRGKSGWFLKTHENERVEAKQNFALKPEHRFADPLRSIAGLANNEGGFIFFGIKDQPDGSLQVVGMSDDAFSKADPADLNRCLAGAFVPVPTFATFMIELDGKSVGVIHVEKHHHAPVVALKNVNNEFREGAIYYRYVGETRPIKPGELHRIIAHREQKAVAEFASRMSKVASGETATLNLDNGKIEGKAASFMIGEDLLPKIQFLREGEFKEQVGAAALRLVGDVSAVQTGAHKTVRTNVTDEATLLNYLRDEVVAEPLAYVLHSASGSRGWLPQFHYARASNLPLADLIEKLKLERQSHRRTEALQRLSGKKTAFQKPVGKGILRRNEALRGGLQVPVTLSDVPSLARGIQALPDDAEVDFGILKDLLIKALDLTSGASPKHGSARSQVYRAACRLDELEYGRHLAERDMKIAAVVEDLLDKATISTPDGEARS